MNDSAASGAVVTPAAAQYKLWQVVRDMLALDARGFGDPVALVGSSTATLVRADRVGGASNDGSRLRRAGGCT